MRQVMTWFGLALVLAGLMIPTGSAAAAAAKPGRISITAEDVAKRELQLMTETKQRLLTSAKALTDEAERDPKALNQASYAKAYEDYQDELRRARKRVWWKQTPAVKLPEVPAPGSAAYTDLERREDETQRQAESQRREQARRDAALRLQRTQAAAQVAALAEERRQTQELQHQSDYLDAAYDNGYVLPYGYGYGYGYGSIYGRYPYGLRGRYLSRPPVVGRPVSRPPGRPVTRPSLPPIHRPGVHLR